MLSEIEQGRERIDAVTEPNRVSLVTLIAHFGLAALKLPAHRYHCGVNRGFISSVVNVRAYCDGD